MTNKRYKEEAMTISRLGQRRQIVIPKRLCEELSLREGDFIEVIREKNNIVLKPKTLVDIDDILTKEEEEIVKKGEAQLANGEYVLWEDVKNTTGL